MAADERRVGVGDEAASLNATLPLLIRCPAYEANRSLIRNGTPRNGPSGSSAARGGLAGVIEPADHDRIDGRVVAFDALDRRLKQLAGRHLARRDEGRLIVASIQRVWSASVLTRPV